MDNPMATIPSMAYLIGYGLCIVAAVVLMRIAIAGADKTRGFQPPLVAPERDPSAVAYLRGEGNELLRFRIFDLVRRGYLQVSAVPEGAKKRNRLSDTLEAAPSPPAGDGLDALDHAILGFYDAPKTTTQLFASSLPATADAYGRMEYRAALEREGMYASAEMKTTARNWATYSAIALATIAVWRLTSALLAGRHNVGFLIVLAIAGIVIVLLNARVGRLSAHGKAFLERLQAALKPMRGAPVIGGGMALPIFVAATGTAALAGTEYAPINGMFRRQANPGGNGSGACSSCSTSSGGDGDSGGSSCGGGGGCGGGCGG